MNSEVESRTYRPPSIQSRELEPILTPNWVIIGLGDVGQGRVGIMASDSLDAAEMQADRRWVRYPETLLSAPDVGPTDYTVKLTILGRSLSGGGPSFWMIYAPTYAQCMARLAELWTPRERRAGA